MHYDIADPDLKDLPMLLSESDDDWLGVDPAGHVARDADDGDSDVTDFEDDAPPCKQPRPYFNLSPGDLIFTDDGLNGGSGDEDGFVDEGCNSGLPPNAHCPDAAVVTQPRNFGFDGPDDFDGDYDQNCEPDIVNPEFSS